MRIETLAFQLHKVPSFIQNFLIKWDAVGVFLSSNSAQIEWFASIEPWRDKVETSMRNSHSKKNSTPIYFPYAYLEYNLFPHVPTSIPITLNQKDETKTEVPCCYCNDENYDARSKLNKPQYLIIVDEDEEAEILDSPIYDETTGAEDEYEGSRLYSGEYENVPRHEKQLVLSEQIKENEVQEQEEYESPWVQEILTVKKELQLFVMRNSKELRKEWPTIPAPWRVKIEVSLQHIHLEDNLDNQHSSVKDQLEIKTTYFVLQEAPFDWNAISKRNGHGTSIIFALNVQAATK